jgi:ABC-type polar amino acid transport system ATPase subunit
MGFAQRVADRIWFMERGELKADATTEQFFKGEAGARAREFLKQI